MRRVSLILSCFLLLPCAAHAQLDSAAVSKTLRLLDQYVTALENEDLDSRVRECDFLVESCTDSLVRQEVTLHLYDHYVQSQLMGDETVAIHIFDRWLSSGEVKMRDEMDMLQARIFAEFNRSSLLGMDAPSLELSGPDDAPVSLPGTGGRRSILYFYDTDCPKCRLESILLRVWLDEVESEVDFYAIYVGTDRDAWLEYAGSQFQVKAPGVHVIHAWDPDTSSDMQRLYGLLQTPRLFLLDSRGVIAGRRLTVDALKQLFDAGSMDEELMARCPEGSSLPHLKVPGILRTSSRTREKSMELDRLKGSPAYLIFHTPGCSRCEAELASLPKHLKGRAKAFLVDMDEILAGRPGLAKELFDAFDLSVLPHIISLDKKGIVNGKYLSLSDSLQSSN